MVNTNEPDYESKKEQFRLFEYANYCGLLLGVLGACIVEIILLYFKKSKSVSLVINSPEGFALIGIGIIAIVLYKTIKDRTYKMIGVFESVKIIYTYNPKKDDAFEFFDYFIRSYKSHKINKDKSLEYKFLERKDKSGWDSNKNEGEIMISHKTDETLNILIEFKNNNSISVLRPAYRPARRYTELLESFLLKNFKNDKLFEDLKIIHENATEETI